MIVLYALGVAWTLAIVGLGCMAVAYGVELAVDRYQWRKDQERLAREFGLWQQLESWWSLPAHEKSER